MERSWESGLSSHHLGLMIVLALLLTPNLFETQYILMATTQAINSSLGWRVGGVKFSGGAQIG